MDRLPQLRNRVCELKNKIKSIQFGEVALKLLEDIEAETADSRLDEKEILEKHACGLTKLFSSWSSAINDSFRQALDDQIKGKAKVPEEEIKEKNESARMLFNILATFVKEVTFQFEELKFLHYYIDTASGYEEKIFTNPILMEIARLYIRKYNRVPKSTLDTIAALFSSKHSVKEWENLHQNVLSSLHQINNELLSKGEDAIETNLLNLNLTSYAHLHSNLQTCLFYCSLFPKGYIITKTNLVHMWDSQEHLLSAEGKSGLVGNEYFEELLKKGYFFEYFDGTGDMLGYKMPYLVHEFLKGIEKPGFCFADESAGKIEGANILHLSFVVDSSWKAPLWLRTAKRLQTLLFLPRNFCEDYSVEVPNMNEIFSSLTCLRALDLIAVDCEKLLSSLGELKDLRYLRLGTASKNLPESVTRLQNLQTLDLRYSCVIKLPTEFHRLSHMYLYSRSRLTDMQTRFVKSLQSSDEFIVGEKSTDIEYLGELKELVWKLTIRGWKEESWKEESLQKQLNNNLVCICIEGCSSCKDLPQLSSLPHLKSLRLWDLNALVYIENDDDDNSSKYFPSLQYLMLANLPKLKGWSIWAQQRQLFWCQYLSLESCPMLTSMPLLPILESLQAHNIHRTLLKNLLLPKQQYPISKLRKLEIVSLVDMDSTLPINAMTLESLTIKRCPKLKMLDVQPNINSLRQLVIHECSALGDTTNVLKHLFDLQKLEIKGCENLSILPTMCPSLPISSLYCTRRLGISLHSLKLINISNLDSLKRGILCLQSLKEFSLHSLCGLNTLPEWIGSLTQLRRLAIRSCPFLDTLPESLRFLTGLEQLEIQSCPRLRKIPKSFDNLCSLKQLKIQQCATLLKRCQRPNGEDFHLIQHVPERILE